MKQTNNAIKFLMAQYRAIFKNANIAMVAAMAAAALAAGQAQAKDLTTADEWKAIAADTTIGAADSTYEKITVADADAAGAYDNTNSFTLTLKGGASTIAGKEASAVFKAVQAQL